MTTREMIAYAIIAAFVIIVAGLIVTSRARARRQRRTSNRIDTGVRD